MNKMDWNDAHRAGYSAKDAADEAWANRQSTEEAPGEPKDDSGTEKECLTVADWIARDLPPLDCLMGDLLSTTTRMMLIAPTGLGKTNFTMALSFAMAGGQDFLHWRSIRPARVLFIDGEMSRRLVKIRLAAAVKRFGSVPPALFVLCREDYENMPPLNTQEGQAFIDAHIKKIGGVDFVVFDNIQALIFGDLKDEEVWRQTLTWVKNLTRRSIGQMWIHHTGINETRGYGDKSKEWQMETIALMEAVERDDTDIAFTLKFPKARERAPHNRSDFEPVTVILTDDEWSYEAVETATKVRKPPSPKAMAFHKALLEAVSASGLPRHESVNQPSVTTIEWQAECIRRGLIDKDAKPNSIRASMSKYRLELIAANWVSCSQEYVWNRKVAL